MTDPVTTLGIAAQAVGLVNGTIGLLKEARESAKRSDDHDLKDKLSDVFDSVLALKEVIGDLKDENGELRKSLEARASVRWDTKLKLYLAEGDPDPFCPACMDLKGQQIRLFPVYYGAGELWKYDCKVCKSVYQMA